MIILILTFLLSLSIYSANISATLDSNNGSSNFCILNSGGTPVSWIDSSGNILLKGGLRLDSAGVECTTAELLIVDGKIGVGVTNPVEKFEINGALLIGNAAGTTDGTIRWTGTDFEGRKGGAWVSFTTGITDHGTLGGLGDDDHSQYHNNTRGDARYYTKTLLDAGQLDNRYFTESEHLASSSGAGDSGKPVKLNGSGHIDSSMLGSIDHGSIAGLGDDDHSQYLLVSGTRALSGDWNIGDGRMIQADMIRARDGDGLALYEDGGEGMFVEDGGQVGIGTSSPNEALAVEGNLSLREQESAPSNTANYGKFYVKSADSNPYFMTDGGTEKSLAVPDYIYIVDRKTKGTAGGDFNYNAWRTRALNTKLYDTGNNASVSSNTITLAAGTYRCRVIAPAFRVDRHMIRLYNSSDSTVVAYGNSAYSASGNNYAQTCSVINAEFTIASSKNFIVQHYCKISKSSNGFGVELNLTGVYEIYTMAEFWKIK